MKEFIKCRNLIANKRNIQCVMIECLISGECNIFIKLNNDTKTPIYIMCNNEAEARKEFDNIYKQLQEDTEESQPKTKFAITLREFWNNKKPLAIHCNTKEKAKEVIALNKFRKVICNEFTEYKFSTKFGGKPYDENQFNYEAVELYQMHTTFNYEDNALCVWVD